MYFFRVDLKLCFRNFCTSLLLYPVIPFLLFLPSPFLHTFHSFTDFSVTSPSSLIPFPTFFPLKFSFLSPNISSHLTLLSSLAQSPFPLLTPHPSFPFHPSLTLSGPLTFSTLLFFFPPCLSSPIPTSQCWCLCFRQKKGKVKLG